MTELTGAPHLDLVALVALTTAPSDDNDLVAVTLPVVGVLDAAPAARCRSVSITIIVIIIVTVISGQLTFVAVDSFIDLASVSRSSEDAVVVADCMSSLEITHASISTRH